MRNVQDKAEPNSGSNISGETGDTEVYSGWKEADFDHSVYQREWSKEYNFKIIKLANKKANLLDILKDLKIKFEIVHSPSGFTHKSMCPFKDHRDSSPSFFYNTIDNSFKCFGCNRRGGAVQFLHHYTGEKKTKIAKNILSNVTDIESAYEEIYDDCSEKFNESMIKLSDYIRNFLKGKDGNYLKLIEDIMWSLDLYIEKNFGTESFDIEVLEARIESIKERIRDYE